MLYSQYIATFDTVLKKPGLDIRGIAKKLGESNPSLWRLTRTEDEYNYPHLENILEGIMSIRKDDQGCYYFKEDFDPTVDRHMRLANDTIMEIGLSGYYERFCKTRDSKS